MTDGTSPTISFDVLLRGKSDDVSVAAGDLELLRPTPESIERCFRWLSEQGVTCHRTDFGLACEASVQLFELLFRAQVATQEGSGAPTFRVHREPQPPQEIASLVSQITVARPPELFG